MTDLLLLLLLESLDWVFGYGFVSSNLFPQPQLTLLLPLLQRRRRLPYLLLLLLRLLFSFDGAKVFQVPVGLPRCLFLLDVVLVSVLSDKGSERRFHLALLLQQQLLRLLVKIIPRLLLTRVL